MTAVAVAVTLRFIMCLLLAVHLFSAAWGDTNAYALEDEEDFFSTEKNVPVDGIPNGSVATKSEIRGRKMIQNKVIIKRVEIRGSGAAAHGETASENKAVAGKLGSKGNNINSKNNKEEPMIGGGTSKGSISHFPHKSMNNEAAAGFVAFSADYHAPRHHPPKNN
ncbi:uncharacterized protein LOC112534050 [Ricinus communis]|uniref:uncharacterized protein LOC112534050 n=1 Tax=Ricinus communis TaxID=3988 RepID=UPI00201AA95B|nr:uncharacterized protein LOC112534050 [Ricinus communis]